MKFRDWTALFTLLFSLALIAAAFWLLPEDARVPLHWNAVGTVDRWGDKARFLRISCGMPLSILLLGVFYCFAPRIFGGKEGNVSATRNILVMTLLYICGAQAVVFYAAWSTVNGANVNVFVFNFITAGIGFLFVVIGNVMPKLKMNRWAGIRCKWTMEDPEVWYKVHRTGGKLWVAAGIIIIITTLLLPPQWTTCTMLGVVAVITLYSMIQAWYLARRKRLAKEA